MLVRGDDAERDIAWVASSDLPDPTPFLERDQLVLSTGRQFADFGDADFGDYVTRLRDAGVVGIGFGTEVLRDGVPDGLLAACRELRMTLIEVPYRTPFLALIRWVATEIERSARRRDEWALEALRAIPAATLAGNARAALVELAHRIDGSVLLVDRSGRAAAPIGAIQLGSAGRQLLAEESQKLLALGRRGGRDLLVEEGTATFQTLGPGGRLAGVLVVVTTERPDRAARLVVNAVVALLEVALWHEGRAESARHELAERALVAVVGGDHALAHALVEAAGGRMPRPPLIVSASLLDSPAALDAARALLDDAGALAGVVDGTLVALSSGASWRRRVATLGGRSGVVTGVEWETVGLAVERARAALRRATAEQPVVLWDAAEARAVDIAVDSPTMASFADAAISAVLADEHGAELLRYAAVWMQEDGRWDASASILGLHRHSLRARMSRLGVILGLDLETLEGRVNLHLLLRASQHTRHP